MLFFVSSLINLLGIASKHLVLTELLEEITAKLHATVNESQVTHIFLVTMRAAAKIQICKL